MPHRVEGRHFEDQRRPDAAVVVQMLDWVHAQAGEGLDVGVAVVQRVHVLVCDQGSAAPVLSSRGSNHSDGVMARRDCVEQSRAELSTHREHGCG